MPTYRKTRRRRGPNTNTSNDAEAEGPSANASKDAETKGTQANVSNGVEAEGAQLRVEQSRLALLFVFTYSHVHPYKPKEDYPSLGTIYSFSTPMCDAQPMKRTKIKLVEISQLGTSSIVIHPLLPPPTAGKGWNMCKYILATNRHCFFYEKPCPTPSITLEKYAHP